MRDWRIGGVLLWEPRNALKGKTGVGAQHGWLTPLTCSCDPLQIHRHGHGNSWLLWNAIVCWLRTIGLSIQYIIPGVIHCVSQGTLTINSFTWCIGPRYQRRTHNHAYEVHVWTITCHGVHTHMDIVYILLHTTKHLYTHCYMWSKTVTSNIAHVLSSNIVGSVQLRGFDRRFNRVVLAYILKIV